VSSVLEVKPTGVRASYTGTDPGDVSATYQATFWVKTDDPLDMPDMVRDHFRATSALPFIGRKFKLGNGFDGEAVCRAVEPDYIPKSGGCYNVVCRFEPDNSIASFEGSTVGTTESGKVTEDPLLYTTEIEMSWSPLTEPAYDAKFFGFVPAGIRHPFLRPGNRIAIMNSAMKVFDPTLEVENFIQVIRITQNFNRFDGDRYDRYKNTVNSNLQVIARPGFGFRRVVQPYQGKMAFYGASLGFENGVFFWREAKEVHIHPRSWIRQVPDMGTEELLKPGDVDEDGTELSADNFPASRPWDHRTIVDNEGLPNLGPCLLDGKGRRLAPDKPPVFLKYLPEIDDDWTGIPF
jgi:hypothetical protein